LTTGVAVLLNPTAGRGRHGQTVRKALDVLRSSGATIEVLDASTPDEAEKACRDAVAAGAGGLVAVGGDGTVHLALQAVARTGVPFGIIPAGTGNDFAAEVGLPTDLNAAAQNIADALGTGRIRTVDLARTVGPDGYERWYGAVLGAGFDAIVNERANAMRWPRGPRRYDIATYAELLRMRPRRYTLTLDGDTQQIDAVLVAVGNTASYGGGMRICPDASVSDGLLDVVVAGAISRTTLVRLKPHVYKGTHVDHPKVTTFRARTVGVAAEGITAYVDGERACPLPVTITAEAGALHLLTR
jgi:diacylglycerol kinase (ATP)